MASTSKSGFGKINTDSLAVIRKNSTATQLKSGQTIPLYNYFKKNPAQVNPLKSMFGNK